MQGSEAAAGFPVCTFLCSITDPSRRTVKKGSRGNLPFVGGKSSGAGKGEGLTSWIVFRSFQVNLLVASNLLPVSAGINSCPPNNGMILLLSYPTALRLCHMCPLLQMAAVNPH